MHFPLSVKALFFRSAAAALLCLPAPLVAQAPPALPLLTTVRQIRRLTPDQASQRYPVDVRAVVTYYSPSQEYWALFAQDKTGGIFIKLSVASDIVPGDQIEVRGVTDSGDFAPMIWETNLDFIAHGPLPLPRRVSFADLASGGQDGAWVEVEGVVRLAKPDGHGRTYMELIVDGQRLSALVTTLDRSKADRLVNATVRLRGVCYSRCNSRRQMRAPWLAVTDGEDIQVLEAVSGPPAQVALTNLLQYRSDGRYGRRVTVRGIVALQQPGRDIFLVDSDQGIRVNTEQTSRLVPGDVVDATGFLVLGQYTPSLEDAVYQQVGRGPPPQPRDAQTEQLLVDSSDGSLVRVRARLVNQAQRWRDQVLMLQSSNTVLTAHLDNTVPGSVLPDLEDGSELELTGICALQPLENWNPSILTRPQSFQILLRTPDDVRVISRPSWWTLRRLGWMAAILGGALLAGLIWAAALDLRVRRQARVIQAKVQREAVLEERSRIAREFHDTLEQELAAISIQLDTVSAQFEDSPAIARELLELTRNMSRRSLAEARRSVWDLRSHLLENNDLVTAVSEVAKALGASAACPIVVSTSGHPRKLPVRLENNLLRLAQEAMTNALKHAQASHISVQIEYLPEKLILIVRDDGIGFNAAAHASADEGHFGLLDMRERVERIGASLHILTAPGQGTRITVEVAARRRPEPSGGSSQHELPLEEAV